MFWAFCSNFSSLFFGATSAAVGAFSGTLSSSSPDSMIAYLLTLDLDVVALLTITSAEDSLDQTELLSSSLLETLRCLFFGSGMRFLLPESSFFA